MRSASNKIQGTIFTFTTFLASPCRLKCEKVVRKKTTYSYLSRKLSEDFNTNSLKWHLLHYSVYMSTHTWVNNNAYTHIFTTELVGASKGTSTHAHSAYMSIYVCMCESVITVRYSVYILTFRLFDLALICVVLVLV